MEKCSGKPVGWKNKGFGWNHPLVGQKVLRGNRYLEERFELLATKASGRDFAWKQVPGRKIQSKIAWKQVPGRKIQSKIAWKPVPGRKIQSKIAWKPVPARQIQGKVGWQQGLMASHFFDDFKIFHLF